MKTLATIINAAHGIRHLFLGGFATPREHRSKLARWPGDTSIPENDLRAIIDSWGQQQTVAWLIARGLAWITLIRALAAALS